MSTPASEVLPRVCSVAGALDVIGEKWSLLVVRELILGVHRFNEIATNTGAPRDILTARLRRLEELGVVERRAYSDRPPRYEYVLTCPWQDVVPRHPELTVKVTFTDELTGRQFTLQQALKVNPPPADQSSPSPGPSPSTAPASRPGTQPAADSR